MIRNYEIDRTIQQTFPQPLSVIIVSDRWTTLEEGLTRFDLFGSETEVVETSFDRDW